MSFNELNYLIKSAPFFYHIIASSFLVGGLAHLIIKYGEYTGESIKAFGLKQTFVFFLNMKKSCFRKRIVLFVSLVFNTVCFFGKVSDPNYTILDIFLPLYLCYYFLAKDTILALSNEMLIFKDSLENGCTSKC